MSQVVRVWWRQLPLEKMIVLAAAPVAVAWLVLILLWLWRRWRTNVGRPGDSPFGPWPLPGLTSARLAIAVHWSVVAVALIIGFRKVIARASLFDDAYISFRYARNFAEGHGLVFNLDERVEGYTNFLWTLILGFLHWLTPLEVPELALVLGPLCFGASLLVVARLGRLLTAGGPHDPQASLWHVPLAALLLALHRVFTDYGTSGLETGAASLFVSLGVLGLISRRTAAGAGMAGLMFICAALARPDHGLFYALGGLVVLSDQIGPMLAVCRAGSGFRLPPLRRRMFRLPPFGRRMFRLPPFGRIWHAGGDALAAYAAPFSLYGAYLLWKFAYYGDIVPNTYYAKSVALTWYPQGRIYAATFYLGSQAWAPLLLCFVWLVLRPRHVAARRFKLFFVSSFIVYNFYVAKLGGDFMYGRFYVSLIPLYLLSAEALIHGLAHPRLAPGQLRWRGPGGSVLRWTAVAAGLGLLAASTQMVTMIRPSQIRWGIADEATFHFVKSFRPLSVAHHQEPTGKFFRRVLKDRGLELVLGTGGPGTVGYHCRLPIIDVRGLTDAYVARQKIGRRVRPGHDKIAPRDYLIARGVHLLRTNARQEAFHPARWRRLTQVGLDRSPGQDPWQLAHYDRDMMRRVREKAPELRFVEFEGWLDRYIEALPRRKADQVRVDLKWLRRYYFDHNDDPERLAVIEARSRGRGGSIPKQRKLPQL